MGKLTTHVLDTMSGLPAADLAIALWRSEDDGWRQAAAAVTNLDGRVEQPLLESGTMVTGVYELRFEAGRYFRKLGVELHEPPFLDVVTVRFGISDPDRDYHVPLLLSAYGYSTYRGS